MMVDRIIIVQVLSPIYKEQFSKKVIVLDQIVCVKWLFLINLYNQLTISLKNNKIISVKKKKQGDYMYNEKIFLTPQEILEKEFKIDAKGYRPQEVDKFLDMVIRDYTEFASIINKLKNDNKYLAEDNAKLKAEYRKLKNIIDSAEENNGSSNNSFNNIDLLKRISNLEKIVYCKDE